MSVIVDLSLFPIGHGESLHAEVNEAIDLVRASGLPHVIGPMGTAIEGEWDEIMALVGRCHAAMRARSRRVYMTMKIDSREGAGRLQQKLAAVGEK